MERRLGFILISGICLLFLNIGFISAEMETAGEEETLPPEPIKITEQITNSPEAEAQWIWGEVVVVDTAGSEILVKYLDYDADQEKEMTINVDGKTIFENAKSIDEIKPQDTVSIDYIVTPEGKNVAKNISIEKIEEESPVSVKEPEANSSESMPFPSQE